MGLDTTTSRYRSRILREMNANRENPFNSPPSSTGSHGTVSPTMSSVISDPDGESTRRLNEDIARLTGSRNGKPQVNWEAAHIKWPEFYGMPKDTTSTAQQADEAFRGHDRPGRAIETKKNNNNNMPSKKKNLVQFLDDSTQDPWQDSKRTRAEMQPRVDNDSDNSSTFSKSPIRFDMRRPDMARLTHQPRTRSPLSRAHKRVASGADHQQQQQPLPPQSPSNGKGPLSRSQTSPSLAAHAAETGTSNQAGGNNNVPFKHSPANLNTIRKSFPSPVATDSPLHNGATVQSFFMPDISHLNDLVSGTLRVGGLKDGVPVFVKNGRVRDRADIRAPNDHAEVEGLAIPEDEENIFISMDKIREEIENLQQHDDIMQRHAESLQGEVDRLQNELSRFKSRKSIDSALGSRTGSEPETAAYEQLVTEKLVLESQVASLQARLDQASRRIGVDEVENNTLSLERDRALKKLQDACENIGDLMDKLDLREKELNDTQKKLDATLQMQGNNNTQTASRSDAGTSRREHNAQDGHDGQDGHEGLESENKSLRADNTALRREQQKLREEVESLREDNNSLRREHESLLSENRSLRSSVRALMTETEELRRTVDDGQREVASAREESDALHQELEAMEQERDSLKEDNDSLVRHNEKYFGENKLLRRENGGFERSIHDLHDENERLKEEVEFLKEQLDHCRPIGKDHDFSARLGQDNDYDNDNDYDEENMTSAFFVPDITIDENSAVVDPTLDSVKGPPDMPTRSQRPTEIADTTALTEGSVAGPDDTADLHKRPSAGREKALVEGRDDTGHVQQKVAFSLPDVTQDTTRGTTTTNNNMANKGSKRRSASRAGHRSNTTGTSIPELEAFHLLDQDNSMVFSPDITQNLSVALDTQARGGQTAAAAPSHSQSQGQGQGQSQSQSQKTAGIKSSMKSKHHRSATVDVTTTRRRQDANTTATSVRSECPALSPDARRVLDGLCEHNCNNCVVCSRISSHRGTVTLKEAAEGKKRVKVPKPVPASEQQQQQQQKALQHQQQKGHQRYTDEPTMRPWQAPGTALAMVIKGLEDEAAHMKMELARLQARYGELDASVGRRERKEVASRVKEALRRLEVKNDQIYALYDVLEGQKQAGQAMTEEELEVTIFSITGLTVRDISLNLAREGVAV